MFVAQRGDQFIELVVRSVPAATRQLPHPTQPSGRVPVLARIGAAEIGENEVTQHRQHAERIDLLVGILELGPGMGVGQPEVVRDRSPLWTLRAQQAGLQAAHGSRDDDVWSPQTPRI